MKKEVFLKHLTDFIEKHKEDYSNDALVSSVIVKEKGVWKNCLSKIRVIHKNEKVKVRSNVIYDKFALIETVISVKNIITILGDIERGFKMADFNIIFADQVFFEYKNYESGNNDFSEYAGNSYIVGGNSVRPINYPTVKYDVPCYRDGYHAITDWISLPYHSHFPDALLGKVLIFLPNFKARIKSMMFKDNKLLVETEGRNDVIKSLQCQGVFTVEGNKTHINKNFNGNPSITFELNDEPKEVFVQLVTADSEKVDYYEETPYRHTGNKRLLKKEIDQDLLGKIKNGENERVEFKEFIQEKNKKIWEVVKTVLAFANREGGSILLGISDEGEIKGIPNFKVEEYKEYKNYLKKIIKEHLNKGLNIWFKDHVLMEKRILELIVPEGNDKPYFSPFRTKKLMNVVYIRRGGSNIIADPETEILQLINKRR